MLSYNTRWERFHRSPFEALFSGRMDQDTRRCWNREERHLGGRWG